MVTRLSFLLYSMKYIKFLIAAFVVILLNSCAALFDFADALSEISNTTNNTSSASHSSSSSNSNAYTSSYNTSSSSYSTSSSSTPKKTRVKVECWACKGTGKSSSRNYPATYGLAANEIKYEYCKYCGKKDKVHTHKTCTACKGLGYTYEYK